MRSFSLLLVVFLSFAATVFSAAPFGNNGKADYIVVGAGASGCALIRGLLDAGYSVIALEAGENFDHLQEVWDPKMHQLQFDALHTKYDWPQVLEHDYRVGKVQIARTGRALGGSSTHFTMEYVLPSNASLAHWQAVGGPAWSVQNITQVFRNNERFVNEETGASLPGRGTQGLIDVRRPERGPETGVGSLANALAQWTAVVGNTTVLDDFNSFQGPRYGAFPRYDLFQTPQRRRESASTAFLGSDVMNPDGTGKGPYKNKFRAFFGATALRILFKQKGAHEKKAVGVLAAIGDEVQKFEARRDIILTSGMRSSHLLQISGIGNATLLQSLGIPVVFNNPNVGLHLHNHPSVIRIFYYNNPMFGDVSLPTDLEGLMAGGAFFPEILADGSFGPVDPSKPRVFQTVWSGVQGQPSILVFFSALEQPASTGWLRAQSKNPLTNPLIDQQQFTQGDDLEQFARFHYHFVEKQLKPYLQAQMGGFFFEIDMETAQPVFSEFLPSLDAAKAWILKNQIDASHYCSTNRMSPTAATGVVDWAGRVHGVRNLRVADSSIFPGVPDSNTGAPSMMVGSMIAKLIAQGY